MDLNHEAREAILDYAAAETGDAREQVIKDMDAEDHEQLDRMIAMIAGVAERYALHLLINELTSAREVVHRGGLPIAAYLNERITELRDAEAASQ